MKHFRQLLPLLLLALLLSACAEPSTEPYTYNYRSDSTGYYEFTVNPEHGTITHGDDVYTYQIEVSRTRTSYVIDYPNGAIFHWTAGNGGGSGGWDEDYDPERYIPGDIIVHALEQNQPRQKQGNIGIGLLLIGLGAVNFFLPELPFYLKYGWAVENAEPSDAYIAITKTGGVVLAVAGLFACIL